MKLLRLRLRHFRGIEGREIEFAPRGVTLVTGPNEIGKSSFAESLNLLFDEIDSTRKQRVQAVMPVDRDEGSEIEAELEIGPYRLSYSKRFHRSPYTRLQIHTPRVENHTGRAAHDRVLEILDECIDTDLWKALRVQQGESLFQQPLGDAAGLAAALDAAAGVGAEGARERGLLEATEREWARYFTPGGKHKIEIRRAAEQARAAADDLRACAERVDGLEAAVAREGELGAEIAAAERHEREVEETLRGAERLHEQGLALRRASERCDAARERL